MGRFFLFGFEILDFLLFSFFFKIFLLLVEVLDFLYDVFGLLEYFLFLSLIDIVEEKVLLLSNEIKVADFLVLVGLGVKYFLISCDLINRGLNFLERGVWFNMFNKDIE